MVLRLKSPSSPVGPHVFPLPFTSSSLPKLLDHHLQNIQESFHLLLAVLTYRSMFTVEIFRLPHSHVALFQLFNPISLSLSLPLIHLFPVGLQFFSFQCKKSVGESFHVCGKRSHPINRRLVCIPSLMFRWQKIATGRTLVVCPTFSPTDILQDEFVSGKQLLGLLIGLPAASLFSVACASRWASNISSSSWSNSPISFPVPDINRSRLSRLAKSSMAILNRSWRFLPEASRLK